MTCRRACSKKGRCREPRSLGAGAGRKTWRRRRRRRRRRGRET
jgi:hypothetical protein